MAQLSRYPRVPVQPDVKVNQGSWGYFPSACCLAGGDILVAYHERQHSLDVVAGKNMLCVSHDNGETWEPQIVVMDLPQRDTRDPYVMQGSDGTVYLADQQGSCAISRDDGRSWELVFKSLGKGEAGQPGQVHPKYPMLELPDGRIAWTASCQLEPRGSDEPPDRVRATSYSRLVGDQIEWEHYRHPGLGLPDEWAFAETDVPGRLVCMMRTQHLGEYYTTSTSEDYGRSWAPATVSSVWCSQSPSRPLLVRLRDGTVVLIYAERKNSRVLAVPSLDCGRTWAMDRKLVVLDNPDMCWGDFAYPDACETADGRLLCVYYADGDILGTFLDPQEFHRPPHGRAVRSVPGPSAIAFWEMSEPDGDVAHDCAGSNYGKISGATRVDGPLGGALQFDGTGGHVIVPDTDTLRVPRTFTLEARVRIEDAERDMAILSKAPAYYFGVTGGRLEFRNGPTRVVGERKLTPGTWHHVAVKMFYVGEYLRTEFAIDGEPQAGQTEADVLYYNCTYLGTLGDAETWANYWRAARGAHRAAPVTAYRADRAPALGDGEEGWQGLDWQTGFTLLGPGNVARQQTAFKISYDDERLYVRVRAEQERMADIPEHPRLPEDTSGTWLEDLIDLFLAPPERSADNFQIAVNVNGSTYQREHGPGRRHLEWTSEARIAVRRHDYHWQLDLAIPLSSFIDRPIAEGEIWTFHAGRHERPGGQTSGYAPAGGTRFLSEVDPQHNLLFAGVAPAGKPNTYTGIVHNAYGQPVVGARVGVADGWTHTDTEGRFTLTLSTVDVPDVCVIARGYYACAYRPRADDPPASVVLIPETPALEVHAAAAYSDRPVTRGPDYRGSGIRWSKQTENALFIGMMNDGRSNPFKGAICGVGLHRRALRAIEIRQRADG